MVGSKCSHHCAPLFLWSKYTIASLYVDGASVEGNMDREIWENIIEGEYNPLVCYCYQLLSPLLYPVTPFKQIRGLSTWQKKNKENRANMKNKPLKVACRVFHWRYSIFGMRKDCKRLFLTMCKNNEYLYIAVLGKYFKGTYDITKVTIATLGLHKRFKFQFLDVFWKTKLVTYHSYCPYRKLPKFINFLAVWQKVVK